MLTASGAQLPLSLPSTTSSQPSAPKKPCSSEPATTSCAGPQARRRIVVTAGGRTTLAPASSTPAGATSAARSSGVARSTADSRARPTLWTAIDPSAREREAIRAMLRIPRPRTRGECLEEARPCPWVGCRYHLLLEVPAASDNPRFASLQLAVQRQGWRGGRRRGLRAWTTEATVLRWIDEAVERLASMRWSCALDRADAGPASTGEVLELTASSKPVVLALRRRAIEAMAAAQTGRR